MNNNLSEIIISIVFLILLIFLLNPFGILMPNSMAMMLVVGVVLIFALFASFVFKEKPGDERELLHRNIASRFAYLGGTGILVIGIAIQSLSHKLDNWLVVTLGIMVLAKIVGILYSKIKY